MSKDNTLGYWLKPTEYDVSKDTVMNETLEFDLIAALMGNDIETIKTLITAENRDHIMCKFGGHKTPLQQACERAVGTKDLTIVQYFLEIGAEVGTFNESRSPIEVAFHSKYIELGALLCEKDPMSAQHYNEYLTPMSAEMADQKVGFLNECATFLAGEVTSVEEVA
jgi:hypothetical protein